MRKKGIAIHWFRRDLRLMDNPSLDAACGYETTIPLFIWDEGQFAGESLGAASKWWLHQSLLSLDRQLKQVGSSLIIRQGDPFEVLQQIVSDLGVEALFWNELYEPNVLAKDKKILEFFSTKRIAQTFKSYLLMDPKCVLKNDKSPYLVFTAFFNKAIESYKPQELSPIALLSPLPTGDLLSLPLKNLKLEPKIFWTDGLDKAWKPGEIAAREILKEFTLQKVKSYGEDRNIPSVKGTSRLSPYLHFGEISPATVMNHLSSLGIKAAGKHTEQYTKEIFWREFSHYLLFYFPNLVSEPLKKQFLKFPWEDDAELLKLWQKGQTGYPIVDAGMRELWHTGWMHNRVRMVVASFLVKHLLIPWQKGAEWFWDTLVDANLANNSQGWQWTAGCGADAAPYFRIFNPVLQSKKFDAAGSYVKKWCPELENLPAHLVHEPWSVEKSILKQAGVRLGENYPYPIVDHAHARLRALIAYDHIVKP